MLKKIAKRSKFLRKIMRFVLFKVNKFRYELISKNTTVEDGKIIFASFDGRGYSDSPKALYEQILKEDKYKNFSLVWAFENPEEYAFLEQNPNTRVVNIKSKEYLKELASAKYWFINFKMYDHIFPKENQVLLQCWHGTPLKKLGFDLDTFTNAMNTAKELAHRYELETRKYSYFLSPSRFASEKFISAWNLKAQNKENIILETGYPRNDFLFNYTDKNVKEIKAGLNIPQNKKVLLYAPTYRDNQHSAGKGYTYKTETDFDRLKEMLGDEYIVLFRAHYFVANSFDFLKYKDFIIDVSGYDDISRLYVISDILITDYSSVFFDYACLKRPIILYCYDLEEYRDSMRGFYFDIESLPFPIVKNEEDLAREIKNDDKENSKYPEFINKYCYLDDGKASKRVLDKVFTGVI